MVKKIPSIVTVTATKVEQDSPTGVSFKDKDGTVVVSSIKEESIFHPTALSTGHEILAINERTGIKDAKTAASIVREAHGKITILACTGPRLQGTFIVVVKRQKDEIESSFGARFRSMSGYDFLVRVAAIDPKGPFAKTPLRVNNICIAIDQTVISDPRVAARALKKNATTAMMYYANQTFRERVVSDVAREDKNLWEVKWISSDRCTLRQKQHVSGMTLEFQSDESCKIVAERKIEMMDLATMNVTSDKESYVAVVDKVNARIKRNMNFLQNAVEDADRDPEARIGWDEIVEKVTDFVTCSNCGESQTSKGASTS